MPRLTRVRIGALDDLLSQLRFAPGATARRHLANAEALAREIDPERNYLVTDLARRITGLRADPAEIEDAMIVGRALAGELSALIERLSHLSGLRFEELGVGALRLSDLCARWGVDRKTVERRRREGLVAHRVIAGGSRGLAFRRSWVEAYERSKGGRVGGAPRARTSERERLEIVRRAVHASETEGLSRSSAAKRAAEAVGRSHETARRALRRAEARGGERLIPGRGKVTARERGLAARAWGRGVEVGELAERLERSRASAHRIVLEGRLERLAGLDLRCATSEMFARKDASEVLLAPRDVREGLAWPACEEWSGWLARSRDQRAGEASRERSLGAALCYLRWRAGARIARMVEGNASASGVDEAETDLRWAWWLAGALARTQGFVGVRNLEERLGGSAETMGADRARSTHEAIEGALLRAALVFDPFRGGRGTRLAGTATVMVTRALSMLGEQGVLEIGRGGAARARGVVVEDVSWRVVGWNWLTAGPVMRERASRLEGEAGEVVRLRWGLWEQGGRGEPPRTRADVSARLGIGAARIARHERSWLRGDVEER